MSRERSYEKSGKHIAISKNVVTEKIVVYRMTDEHYSDRKELWDFNNDEKQHLTPSEIH